MDSRATLLFLVITMVAVSGDEDCLRYLNLYDQFVPERECRFSSFCCGNCTFRFCCTNWTLLFPEEEQKRCLHVKLSSNFVIGIVSAVVLFITIVGVLACCLLCSCCYMYQRYQQQRTHRSEVQIPYFIQQMAHQSRAPQNVTYSAYPQYPMSQYSPNPASSAAPYAYHPAHMPPAPYDSRASRFQPESPPPYPSPKYQ
ncbi:protein shisa-4 [Callorhinchus milii]|nr:protein shisa-4 [Callorhinchus milii]|eukprot:gi/632984697/ref/XP_007909269.1/ PREDICTED: protein shisa-4 [Callorhinchus milii]